MPDAQEDTPHVSVLSGNTFGGHADIAIENLNIHTGRFYNTQHKEKHIQHMCADLERFLASSGHMMVVLNHASADKQTEFWTYLWDRGLRHLVERGLFFVHMVDISDKSRGDHLCIPLPDVEIPLPQELDDDRQGHAFDDIIDVLMNVLMQEVPGARTDAARLAEDAYLALEVFIGDNCDNVKKFHDRLPWLITKLANSISRKNYSVA
jgi:hypothetical protein